MKTSLLYQIGMIVLVMTLLTSCDRPLPTEVSQSLTQAAPTLNVLMGTATTIAGQIAATLAAVQLPTGVPLTAEAYVQELSSTAAALGLLATTEISPTGGVPYPVSATPAAVYPAPPVQAIELPTLAPPTEPPVESAISDTPTVTDIATIEVVEPTVEVIETEAVVATGAVVETEVVVETETVVATEELIGTEVIVGTEAVAGTELVVETEPVVGTEAAAATEAVFLGVIQSGTGVSETLMTETAVPEVIVTEAPASEAAPVLVQETSAANLPLVAAQASQEAPVGQESEVTIIELAASGEYQLVIPEIYTLKRGEFPYCIARRFDIHPRKLMNVNGFFEGQMFFPGQEVVIPVSSRPFPGERALRFHPNTHRVGGRETIYSISCYYGDIDPLEIAWLNNLTPPYRLFNGQILTLP